MSKDEIKYQSQNSKKAEDVPIKVKTEETEECEVVGCIKYKPSKKDKKNKKSKKWTDRLKSSRVDAFIETKRSPSKEKKKSKKIEVKDNKKKCDMGMKILFFLLGFTAAFVILRFFLGYRKYKPEETKAAKTASKTGGNIKQLVGLGLPAYSAYKTVRKYRKKSKK